LILNSNFRKFTKPESDQMYMLSKYVYVAVEYNQFNPPDVCRGLAGWVDAVGTPALAH